MNDPLIVVCPHCLARNRVPATRLAKAPACGCCKRALFGAKPVALDTTSFDVHVGRGDLPVLVDFWAPWCSPCLAMAPQFEAATAQLEPHVRMAKVDTEAQPGLGTRYGVRSIPTLVLFDGGREIARRVGAGGAADIVHWVRARLR